MSTVVHLWHDHSPTSTTASPAKTFPTPGPDHRTQSYEDFVLASVANSTWPEDISFRKFKNHFEI